MLTTATLSFLTQKVIHPRTDDVFLLYVTPFEDGAQYAFDLQWFYEEGPNDENRSRCRWWTGNWSVSGEQQGVEAEALASCIAAGELHIKGWSKAAQHRDALVSLKLVINPLSPESCSIHLSETAEGIIGFKTWSLLLKITEEAQKNHSRLFSQLGPSEKGMMKERDRTDYDSELAQIKRQLKKRDHELVETKAELETTSERLNEFIMDQNKAIRATRSMPKIPLNHSKASVTKKRRLVKRAEFEDD